ncbi:protein FAM166B [Oryzias melastigma]|uniref:protein FAM166B n=1 Tax=Oryzias melastigma TaxID=30732 RepID=UPI000CF7D4E4|nr:protein FAM166B [Oryzias melastigma]
MRSCRHTVQTASTEPASLHPPVNIPDSDLNKAIPGYTGFIPRSKNYFGCSFSENCRKALMEFYQEKHKKDLQKSAEMPVVVNYLKQHADGLKVSLKAVSYQEFSSESAKPFIPDGNPYHLDDHNPNKYFMTGFTGHVPKARFLIGKPYSAITKQALILFRKEQTK